MKSFEGAKDCGILNLHSQKKGEDSQKMMEKIIILRYFVLFCFLCITVTGIKSQNPQTILSNNLNVTQVNRYIPQYNLCIPGSTERNQYFSTSKIKSFETDSLFLWQCIQTQVNYYFTDIFFIDSLYGWASHGNSGLLKTTDSGFNWEVITLINSGIYAINGVHFINRDTGWAVGNSGTIRKTTNNGIKWVGQDWEQTSQYYDVHFFNEFTGIVVGLKPYYFPQHSYIIKTTDSGNNWNDKYLSQDTNEVHRQFWLNNDTGWFCGYNILLKTTDCGETYANYYLNVPPTQNGYNGFLDLFFLNNETGWICGSNQDHKNIYKTTNGGNNWIFQDNPVAYYTYPQIDGIIFINSDTGWASSYVGLILLTTNGGTNWLINQTITDETWKFAIYKSSKIWLTGGLGKIWYSIIQNPNRIAINSNEYPRIFQLFQNYPNPFNPRTVIEYDVPKSSNIRIKIYNVLGNEIETLVNCKQSPGRYKISLDASPYASGIYFYSLIFDGGCITKKLVLLK